MSLNNSMNLKNAFTFLKEDTKWVKKLLIGGLLMVIPTVANTMIGLFKPNSHISLALILGMLLMMLFSMIISVFACGYYMKAVKNRMDEKELPQWGNFGELFVIGLKYLIGYFVYLLPFIVIEIMLSIIYTAASQINTILPVLVGILMFIVALTMMFYSFAMEINFAKDFKISSFVRFPQAFKLLKNNMKNYFLLILFYIVIVVVFSILAVFLAWSKIEIVIMPFLTFYVLIVFAGLLGQFSRTKQTETEQVEEA